MLFHIFYRRFSYFTVDVDTRRNQSTPVKEIVKELNPLLRGFASVDINSKIRKTPVENVKKHREKLWTNI